MNRALGVFILTGIAMTAMAEDRGIIRIKSAHAGAETIRRLEEIVRSRGLTVFATIKFSDDAARAGLDMRFTEMLIFGTPSAGTPVMLASPSAAIDLPLKILVADEADGSTWLSCNDPGYLQRRHDIPPALLKNIAGAEALMRAAAHE